MNQNNDGGPSSLQSMADAFDLSQSGRSQAVQLNAAQFIAAYSNVLDIGSGETGFARALPAGCDYRSCPQEQAGAGADFGDLEQVKFGNGGPADVVTCLEPPAGLEPSIARLRNLRALGRPVIFSFAPRADEAARLDAQVREAGFWLEHDVDVGHGGHVCKAAPGAGPPPAAPLKKVLVLSYYNDNNFGDRLGFHVINSLLPAGALVTHASVKPWRVPPDEKFDLLILGIGNSLNAATVGRPELHALIDSVPHTLGVFGTQYRHQYSEMIDPKVFDSLLGKLTTWWARYEEDIQAFGRGRNNTRHLGDFLISAFPLTTPTDRKTLVVEADIKSQGHSLDRMIQMFQTYRRVSTARIHPMLCALTSAESLQFQEQREFLDGHTSGKFRSQLYDIFGRTFEENKFFDVDRAAVARYKQRVEANMEDLRAQIAELLA